MNEYRILFLMGTLLCTNLNAGYTNQDLEKLKIIARKTKSQCHSGLTVTKRTKFNYYDDLDCIEMLGASEILEGAEHCNIDTSLLYNHVVGKINLLGGLYYGITVADNMIKKTKKASRRISKKKKVSLHCSIKPLLNVIKMLQFFSNDFGRLVKNEEMIVLAEKKVNFDSINANLTKNELRLKELAAFSLQGAKPLEKDKKKKDHTTNKEDTLLSESSFHKILFGSKFEIASSEKEIYLNKNLYDVVSKSPSSTNFMELVNKTYSVDKNN